MKTKSILIALTLATLWAINAGAAPLGSTFTYQGRLYDGGAPANGDYDFMFLLYDDLWEGHQVGPYIVLPAAVSNGIFSVELDFGANAFDGGARWLSIGAKPGHIRTNYTTLTPRQPINPAPYALLAANVPNGAITGSKI